LVLKNDEMREEFEIDTIFQNKENNAFYRRILEASIDGCALINNNGLFVDVNASFCEMMGYSEKELLKRSIQDIEEPSSKCLAQLSTACVINSLQFESSFQKKNGANIITIVNASPFAGGQNGWILFFKKVTTELKFELEDRVIPSLLRELFHLTPSFIYLIDIVNRKVLFSNVNVGEILGYSLGDISQMGEDLFPILMHADDFDNFKTKIAPQFFDLADGEIMKFSFRMKHKSGKWVWLEAKETIYKRDKGGNALQKIGICVNITDKQEYLHSLEQDRKRLLAILDGIEDVIYISDPDSFELLHVNKSFELNGEGNVIGKKCYEVIHKRTSPCPFCTDAIIMGEQLGKIHLWEHHDKYKNRWYRCADKAVRWINGKMVRFELATDITEIKRLQNDLVLANEKLKESNEDLEQFAYVASHDLQDPLQLVTDYSQLLARDYIGKFDVEADAYFQHIEDGAIQTQNIITDLLQYTRVISRGDDFKNINSHDIIRHAMTSLKQSIEETNAHVEYDHLPTVFVDEPQIQDVFKNLISNAIKFRGKDKPAIRISAERRNEFWRFSVKDNGIGIDMKHKDSVFTIFQRLHSEQEFLGTGIGLAVCKRIINRHGGNIWLESSPGHGATFHFTIPVNGN